MSKALVTYKAAPLAAEYDAACKTIAECARVEDGKKLQDEAAAFVTWARQANNTEALAHWKKITLRARRRVGEMLNEMEERGERRATGKGLHPASGTSESAERRRRRREALQRDTIPDTIPTLKELGISSVQSSRWRKFANMPDKAFEEKVAATGGKAKPKRGTAARLHKVAAAMQEANAEPDNEPPDIQPTRKEDPANFTTAFMLRVDQSLLFGRESGQLAKRMIEHAKNKTRTRNEIAEHARAVVKAWSELAQSME